MFGEVKSVNEDGTITVVASDETVDRHGETIKVDGWDLKNFKKNAVMLVSHNWSDLPIGKWLKPRVEENKLLMDAKFSETSSKATEVLNLVKEGILNTVSVGLIVKERDEKDPSVITKAELLEVSWVSLPANPNAMALALAKGMKFGLFDEDDKPKEEDKPKKEAKKEVDVEKLLEPLNVKSIEEAKELVEKLTSQVETYKGVLPEYRKLIRAMRKRLGLEVVENEVQGILDIKGKLIELLEAKESTQKQENPVDGSGKVENLPSADAIKSIVQDEVKKVLGKYI